MPASLDHLVIAGTDLSALIAWWAMSSGLQPAAGGAHGGRGTRNALVGIDSDSYIELIGPDPEQPNHDGPRPFGINDLEPNSIQLVTFALAVDDLDEATSTVRAAGVDPGRIESMRRLRPDGVELQWRLAIPPDKTFGGTLPFLIEWGADTPHPATSLSHDCEIESLTLTHPDSETLRTVLVALGLDPQSEKMTIAEGQQSSVAARLNAPSGSVEL